MKLTHPEFDEGERFLFKMQTTAVRGEVFWLASDESAAKAAPAGSVVLLKKEFAKLCRMDVAEATKFFEKKYHEAMCPPRPNRARFRA